MVRVARFWLLSIVVAMAVVISGLVVPEGAAVAEEPSPSVAPALDSKATTMSAPEEPSGEFLEPAPVAVEEAPAEDVPEPRVESVDRSGLTLVSRHEFENRYEKPDGSRVSQFSSTPLNARNSEGEWTEVKAEFHNSDEGWMTRAHPLAPRFEDTDSTKRKLVVERDGFEVSFQLLGAGDGRTESPFWFWDDWSKIAYRDVAEGADVEYELTETSVKDSVILKKRPSSEQDTWTWKIDAGRVDLRLTDTGVRVHQSVWRGHHDQSDAGGVGCSAV